VNQPDGLTEIRVHALDQPGEPGRILVKSIFLANTSAVFSPDGRWIAYDSEESGRPEIYIRPSSGEDRKWQVSVGGGNSPSWSPAGDEIFYLCGSRFLAAPVTATAGEISVGAPKLLFTNHEIFAFDVTPDGMRFIVLENPNIGAQAALDLVVNWFSEVRRKMKDAKSQ
jgi:serine/threonine-protein kinase